MADRVCVARIGAAYGVRGEVRLWSFTEDPAAIADFGPLETEDGARRFDIESLRAAKDHFVARLAGIDTREAAEALRNLDLYVSRARLPAIEEADTYYHADLVGLAAVTAEGTALGTVKALHNFGAGDIIEIMTVGGGETLMLPFTEAVVPEVDLKAKRIVVIVPAEGEKDDRPTNSVRSRASGNPGE
ncbi:MAG TPA: ribosome maturation factor RimM [Pseudolabrys sp.]|nr:ribosome maturation factor RimM [Pseudolabrys sp.]